MGWLGHPTAAEAAASSPGSHWGSQGPRSVRAAADFVGIHWGGEAWPAGTGLFLPQMMGLCGDGARASRHKSVPGSKEMSQGHQQVCKLQILPASTRGPLQPALTHKAVHQPVSAFIHQIPSWLCCPPTPPHPSPAELHSPQDPASAIQTHPLGEVLFRGHPCCFWARQGALRRGGCGWHGSTLMV